MSPGPRSERAARTSGRSSRARLIDTGALLFHEDGFHHVSLERVLREADVCRSNFYYHFRSKEDLAVAVVDRWLEEWTDELIEPALGAPGLTALERVGRIVDGLIGRLEGDRCRGGCPFGTLANAEAEHNERFRHKLVATFDGFARVLEKLYTDAAREGDLPAGAPPPTQLAAATLACVQGGFLLAKTYAGSTPMRQAAAGWMALLGVHRDESSDPA